MTTRKQIPLDALEKVAILVATLDSQIADELLDRLPAEQADMVRRTAVQLENVPADQRERVMQEFLRSGAAVGQLASEPVAIEDAGVELDDSLLRKLSAPSAPSAATVPPASPMDASSPPFRFLREATSADIAKHLRHENPQVIAVVIAHLAPQQAADLISSFAANKQADILRRVAQLDSTDPEVLRDIEKHLKLLLANELRTQQNRALGLATVAGILDASGSNRDELMSNLAQHGGVLASELNIETAKPSLAEAAPPSAPSQVSRTTLSQANRTRPSSIRALRRRKAKPASPRPPAETTPTAEHISFEELGQLQDLELAKLFRSTEPQLTLLALAGASPEFIQRLLGQLPASEASSLQHRLERLGPLRLSDIEHAQQKLAEKAGQLAARGEIQLPGQKRFAAAA